MLQVFSVSAADSIVLDADVVIAGIYLERPATESSAVALDAGGHSELASLYGGNWPATVASSQFFTVRIPLKKGTRIFNISDSAEAFFYLA